MEGRRQGQDAALEDALLRARSTWAQAADPVTGARTAAHCLSDCDGPDAAYWRGAFLAGGYMQAAALRPGAGDDVQALRVESVEALRIASRQAGDQLGAHARFLLGQVDRIERSLRIDDDAP